MQLPHCYKNKKAVEPFLIKAKQSLPFSEFINISYAYQEQDKMFMVVALTHIKNCFKKGVISEQVVKELIELMDTFIDPYQEFHQKNGFRNWEDVKNNIIGGLLNEPHRE